MSWIIALIYQKRQELDEKWQKLNLRLDIENVAKSKVFDLANHTVTITDASDLDFAGASGVKIGSNVDEVS